MKNQNFYLRLIALLLIIMAVFFYNGTAKDKEQAQDIADLSAKVENLEKQQEQILTALQETYEEQKSITSSESSDDQSAKDDTAGSDSKENAASAEETTASMQELNATINLLSDTAKDLKKVSDLTRIVACCTKVSIAFLYNHTKHDNIRQNETYYIDFLY